MQPRSMMARPPRPGTLRARIVEIVAARPGLSRSDVCRSLPELARRKVLLAASDVVHTGHIVSRGHGATGELYVAGTEPPRRRLDRAEVTPEQYRKRVKHGGPRSRTLSIARDLTRRVLSGETTGYPDVERPRVRGDCALWTRPCPFVSCRHHLYLDVNPRNGSIKLNFPDREPDELVESCSLDVAERGRTTIQAVGEMMNVTRERVLQIVAGATTKMQINNKE